MMALTFISGGIDFGIPLEEVKYIEEMTGNIVKMPATPAYIKGIASVRGAVMPIYSLALRLGYPETSVQYLIIVSVNGMSLGLEAENVYGVIDAREEVIPLPDLFAGVQQSFLKDIVLFFQKRYIAVIDVNRLIIQEENIGRLTWNI